MPPRIHITGASGCGVSTLGAALAETLQCPWHDTDAYFWQPTTPPFQTPRPMPDRLDRLALALDDTTGWVLSGALPGWGDPLIPRFTLVAYLHAPTETRMARLRAREASRHGDAIQPGGPMHEAHLAFLAWAEAYDTGGPDMRSRTRHAAWLATLPCPVIRLDGTRPTAALVHALAAAIRSKGKEGWAPPRPARGQAPGL